MSFKKYIVFIKQHLTLVRLQRLFLYIQGVTGGKDQTSGGVPYVKLYRYNPKHLYPKLNGYGDNGQRKVWTSCISA